MADIRLTGSCLCGAVSYRVDGPVRDIVGCHCRQCRKASGHHVAATRAYSSDVTIEGEASLKWYRSSEIAERGFCATCGSQLFWRRLDGDLLSIMAGSLNEPTGLVMTRQIHTESAGDYYEVPRDIEGSPSETPET
ncbi:MAG: GFA family protein [Geminicoccaceae bacterium]